MRVNATNFRRYLWAYLLVLLPLACFAARYDPYAIDGDAVAYMDLADLIRAGQWHAVINGYWHPLYPACLAAGQAIFHTTRWNELGAYYAVNVVIFLLEVASMVLLIHGLVRLRKRLAPDAEALFSGDALCLLGMSLLVIATMRDMTLGKVRTDSLLQALIFAGIGFMLEALALEGPAVYVFSGLMGLSFGLAYLTKSFAFLLTILSVAIFTLLAVWICKRPMVRTGVQGVLALACFAAVAGPYIVALSHQQGRFDFGDSGNLNYVWYVSGTEKFHLQPRMVSRFGSATVDLKHPEKELLQSPGVYSYRAMGNGTYPPWFSPTYWNDRIVPRFNLRLLARRDARNVVLIVRYLVNHPESLLLFALVLATCGRLRGPFRFAWPTLLLGVLVWAIYALVNVEERYVTAAFLLIVISVFACLKPLPKPNMHASAAAMLLFALLPLGAAVRESAEARRQQSITGQVPAWRSPEIFGAAEALQQLGLQQGDSISCIGTQACVHDHYWARLAGVRITSEIYAPETTHLMRRLDVVPDRDAVYALLRKEGAKVLVGSFDPGEMNAQHPAAAGWQRLGDTSYYALRLHPQTGNVP